MHRGDREKPERVLMARLAAGILIALVSALGLIAFRRAPPVPAPAAPTAPTAPAPSLPIVTAAQLKARLDAGEDVFLVFVGTESFFQERRIPGARCVEYSQLDSAFGGFERSREIILYCGCCGDAAEGVSGMAVRRLQSLGFQRVSHLEGHYAG